MEEVDILDDVRPYRDDEIPAAMARIASSPTLKNILEFAFPGMPLTAVQERLMTVKTSDQFRETFVRPLLEKLVNASSSGFTTGGEETITKGEGHLYMSDHRDIVLDGALLQLLLIKADYETSEITFGSNLVSSPFVEDFGRSNKMYKIMRGGVGRELVRNSRMLSEHIHEVVADGRSLWISQRDGRTKDGNDKTDQGLIKMLTMGSGKEPADALADLNIVPVAISYEYESCDAMKAREIYLRRRGPYEKDPGEDTRSILTGIKQYKGEIHMHMCPQITKSEIYAQASNEGNDMLRGVASLIDNRIYESYKLFATNYIAYDIRESINKFEASKYTKEERAKFIEYLKTKASGIEGDQDELFDILLDIYANPVTNKLSIQ